MTPISPKNLKPPTKKTEINKSEKSSINDNIIVNLISQKNLLKPKEAIFSKAQQQEQLPEKTDRPFDVDHPTPLDPTSFPDTKLMQGTPHPLNTLPNTLHMLTSYGISVNYDVIAKDYVIFIPGFKACTDNYDNAAITTLCSLATLNKLYSGQFVSQVFAIASKCQINPVMDMIKSVPWDGKDRLEALYATIKVKDEFPDDLKDMLMRKWFLSAVAAASMPSGFSSRGVLTLQGAQSIGKTRWIASLVKDKALRTRLIKLDVHMDAGNKDSVLLAIRHWLVEIGELDSSFRKDVARLKGFLTNDKDKIRQPYDRKESNYQRRTVFCATVNASDFLIDSTGNTRFWTIPCMEIDYNHEIDMQQVWAQLYQGFKESPEENQWWLTPIEESRLEHFNQAHRVISAVSDILSAELNFDANQLGWHKSSASQLLKDVGIDKPTNAQCRECGAYLRERFGEPRKINGSMKWKVPPKKGAWSPLPDSVGNINNETGKY
jgi:putative DNA primase/helicase